MSADPLFRPAVRADLPDIVRLLADDPLGATRESYASPLPDSYHAAFQAIEDDRNNELIVVAFEDRIVGVLQITYIPYITYRGGWRALIEGVRVHSSMRSSGMGRRLFSWVIEVSPIGVATFFSERGLLVLKSEFLWIWLPAIVAGMVMLLIRRALSR